MPSYDNSPSGSDSSLRSFESVRINPQTRSAQPSSVPVPVNSPDIPDTADGAYYDANTQNFHVVSRQNGVATWVAAAGKWFGENRPHIVRALTDLLPNIAQGVANFVPNQRASQILNGTGAAAAAVLSARDVREQYQNFQAGGAIHPMQTAITGARLASAAMGVITAGAPDQTAPWVTTMNSAGTGFSMAAAALDYTHSTRENQDPRMYNMGNDSSRLTLPFNTTNSLPSAPSGSFYNMQNQNIMGRGSNNNYYNQSAATMPVNDGTYQSRQHSSSVPADMQYAYAQQQQRQQHGSGGNGLN
ncbi:hypothetical protein [Streptomyces sp. NPDC048489]|uniref:hypothetical protein n=1 Tax=Streptomyces sp. NPDC048489 TaxID=3154504 RepID=UPI003439A533